VKKHKGVEIKKKKNTKKHRATTTEAVEISTSLCTFSQSKIQIKSVIWVSHNNNNSLKQIKDTLRQFEPSLTLNN